MFGARVRERDALGALMLGARRLQKERDGFVRKRFVRFGLVRMSGRAGKKGDAERKGGKRTGGNRFHDSVGLKRWVAAAF